MKHLVKKSGRDDIEIASAALHTDEIGSDTHRGTKAKLNEMGIPFTKRAAWLLTGCCKLQFLPKPLRRAAATDNAAENAEEAED